MTWVHDPQRDGAGCTWCGAYAQVDKDNLCENCYEEDEEMITERKTGQPGSISHGTMRPEDLVPIFIEKLEELNSNIMFNLREWRLIDKIINNSVVPLYLEEENSDLISLIMEELFDELDILSPADYYFGANEGDGTDYGWWSHEDKEGEPDYPYIGD